MNDKKRKTLLSGIQPSGALCIGNYLGAIKNWVALQHEFNSIFLLVDMHAITVQQVPADLRNRVWSFAAQYIACGIDPDEATVVIQSHVPQHAELTWVLNSLTYMGELNRMTQFKDKSSRHESNINSALFTYPVLMAADILLYNADLVPVGADQKQHLELSRNLAERFNHRYSPTFTVPEPYIPKNGARVMSLQEPEKKMSKSDENTNNLIALLDEPNVVKKKIMQAVTDSGNEIRYKEERPGISNLLELYSLITEQKIQNCEAHFEGKMYSDLKAELVDATIAFLDPIQKRYKEIMTDKTYLESVVQKGAEQSRKIARNTLSKVYRKIGFIPAKW